MKIVGLLCFAGLVAAGDTRTGRITVYGLGETPELIQRGTLFPIPYTRSIPPALTELSRGPLTVLVQQPSDPSRLVAHHLPAGLENGSALRHIVQAFQPARDKVALLSHPWELSGLLPDNQDLQRAQNPYLVIKDRADVRTDLLRVLGELEVLDDAVRVAPDPYSLSLFPFHYHIPYVEDVPSPFQAQRSGFSPLYGVNPDYHLDYPYIPYKGLYYYPFSQGIEYDEDDYFRYDIYSHPAVKPVAIVPGDEYAIYYPASYPILSTVPFVPAPPPPSVAATPIISVGSLAQISPLAVAPGQVP